VMAALRHDRKRHGDQSPGAFAYVVEKSGNSLQNCLMLVRVQPYAPNGIVAERLNAAVC
jgi:hypothetical protein